jgi:hypothetical protein
MISNLNELEEDSEDLTDAEVEAAEPVANQVAFTAAIRQSLEDAYAVRAYELRRRKPFYYSRVQLEAAGKPDKLLVLRLDWLRKG